jgi:Cu(I)/Ag(I) efflux system membrane fusion protein
MQQSASLSKTLSSATEAKDIEALRKVFALLSEEISAVVQEFGPGGHKALYILKCPMAFDNQGAIWLQETAQTQNPYFGAAMSACGSVIKVVSPQTDEPAGGHIHE